MRPQITVLSVVGTRPEVIKMGPVIQALERETARIRSRVCVTGQHRSMLDTLLPLFGIHADHDLDVMRPGQTPNEVLAASVLGLQDVLRRERPQWVVAEGDTTTVMATAIVAFHEGVPFAHVEAGLRTGDLQSPFPEEFNRRVADLVADRCFAPTPRARDNLLREGVPPSRVLVTGNTVVDALDTVSSRLPPLDPRLEAIVGARERLVLVTAHRRESFGEPFEQLCLALRDLADQYADSVQLVYPVHLNPNVQGPVRSILGGAPNVALLEPLDYPSFVHLLKRAYLVLTDSGGVQEEAPSFQVPVLVMRDVTERPEAVEAGTARLVGTRRETIAATACELLDDSQARRRMVSGTNPFGDGRAAARIVAALVGDPVEAFCPPTGERL